MAERWKDQLDRVRQMAVDKGETWDLSEKDQAALKALLERFDAHEAGAEKKAAPDPSIVATADERLSQLIEALTGVGRAAFAELHAPLIEDAFLSVRGALRRGDYSWAGLTPDDRAVFVTSVQVVYERGVRIAVEAMRRMVRGDV